MLRERVGLMLRLTTALAMISLGLSKDRGPSNPPPPSQPNRNSCTYEYPGDGTVNIYCTPINGPAEPKGNLDGSHYYTQEERQGLPGRLRFLPDNVLDELLSGK